MATELSIDDRRGCEAQALSSTGFISVAEFVRTFGVSESTIRRDLEILEDQGVVRRTHGGAVYVKDSSAHHLAFNERQTTAVAEKRSIARAVAELISPGQTVVLNGGTTCYEVAKAVRGHRLSVISNSVPIALLLSTEIDTEVTLIGGYVYPRTGVALGAMALQQVEGLHASKLILSCSGLTQEGIFNANQMIVDIDRKLMEIADETILAVDHTKFGKPAVVKMCEFHEVDHIVTDAGVDDRSRAWLALLDTKVTYAADTAADEGLKR